jgi:hypothetical protein
MFIVTCDHPYYPSVEYCETIEQAEQKYRDAINDTEAKEGHYDCKIAIAEIVKLLETKSDY